MIVPAVEEDASTSPCNCWRMLIHGAGLQLVLRPPMVYKSSPKPEPQAAIEALYGQLAGGLLVTNPGRRLACALQRLYLPN